jgi:histidine triad (HIT) family protein
MPTLFTRIIQREIPADIVYEDDGVIAIRDIAPQAPVHILIIPKPEIEGIATLPATGPHERLLNVARVVAEQEGLAEKGYRLVINQGEDGGQAVPHLHVHLLGGRPMTWPPG